VVLINYLLKCYIQNLFWQGYRGSSFGSECSAPGGSALSLSETGSLKRQRFRDAGSYGTSVSSSLTSLGIDELAEVGVIFILINRNYFLARIF
jgi:hypothetical protein